MSAQTRAPGFYWLRMADGRETVAEVDAQGSVRVDLDELDGLAGAEWRPVVSPWVDDEPDMRTLRANGSPLCLPMDGGIMLCKHGVWAFGKNLRHALETLHAEIAKREGRST